jgi:hypothetical protein
MKVQIHLLLTLALNGFKELASRPCRLPQERQPASGIHPVELHYTRFIQSADGSKWNILYESCDFVWYEIISAEQQRHDNQTSRCLGMIGVKRIPMDTHSHTHTIMQCSRHSRRRCSVPAGGEERGRQQLMKPVSVGAGLWGPYLPESYISTIAACELHAHVMSCTRWYCHTFTADTLIILVFNIY